MPDVVLIRIPTKYLSAAQSIALEVIPCPDPDVVTSIAASPEPPSPPFAFSVREAPPIAAHLVLSVMTAFGIIEPVSPSIPAVAVVINPLISAVVLGFSVRTT